ncbi:MAG: methionyl-tRNA formyltransferase [Coriobacteriia bacterium]|nr:methionyl-tRNA formyltransferase [Coriobacteriia bacterium]
MRYVIGVGKAWCEDLPSRLEARTGDTFHVVRQPNELSLAAVAEVEPRYVFFPHWSWKIPAEIYEEHECVIFHMTDVPFGRGGSPLQNLILRGHTTSKVSALRCVEEMDAGPVYLKRDFSLEGSAREIFARLEGIIEGMIVELIQNQPTPVPQAGEPVYFARRTPEQSDIAELGSAREIYDHIRMLDAEGYPHAFIETPAMHLEFTDAQLEGGGVTARATIRERSSSES